MRWIGGYGSRCALGAVSGLLIALAYPPTGWGWLVFPGLAGFFLSIRGESGSRVRGLGFLHGMVAYGLGLMWLFHIFGSLALLLARKWLPAVGIAAGLAAAVFGFRPVTDPAASDPQAMKVAGLQMEDMGFDNLVAATRRLPADIPYVVWPEYAVPYDLRADKRDWKIAQDLCTERNITLTLGTQNWKDGGDAWRNIALTLDPGGVRGEHHKVHTVHFFNDGTPGRNTRPVDTRHGKIGTPVCFDCDYEGVCRGMTLAGAEAFIVPMMDAVSWSARQHVQHAGLFRIRACENARWMFVCATSGVSQIIDPHGGVHGSLPPLMDGSLTGIIRRETEIPFYTRWGWTFPWAVLVGALASWVWILIPRWNSTSAEGRANLVDGNA